MITDEDLDRIRADRHLGHPKMWTNGTVQELVDRIDASEKELRECRNEGDTSGAQTPGQLQFPGVPWEDFRGDGG